MALFGKDADQISREVDDLERALRQARALMEVYEADLAGFSNPGYAHFKDTVLTRELSRLAEARMRVSPDDVEAGWVAQGQYNEVERLSRAKDTLERDQAMLKKRIEDMNDRLAAARKRLEKKLSSTRG